MFKCGIFTFIYVLALTVTTETELIVKLKLKVLLLEVRMSDDIHVVMITEHMTYPNIPCECQPSPKIEQTM